MDRKVLMQRMGTIALCYVFIQACTSPQNPRVAARSSSSERSEQDKQREIVVQQALQQLKARSHNVDGFIFADDPVGFVRQIYWHISRELLHAEFAPRYPNDDAQLLFASQRNLGTLHQVTPRRGDLVFLDTPDARADDPPRQLAIVIGTRADGTVEAIGRFAEGVRRIAFNLRKPATAENMIAGAFRTFADPWNQND